MRGWQVLNANYRAVDASCRRMVQSAVLDYPWLAFADPEGFQSFATHAEAITYADKQARRTA